MFGCLDPLGDTHPALGSGRIAAAEAHEEGNKDTKQNAGFGLLSHPVRQRHEASLSVSAFLQRFRTRWISGLASFTPRPTVSAPAFKRIRILLFPHLYCDLLVTACRRPSLEHLFLYIFDGSFRAERRRCLQIAHIFRRRTARR